MNKVILMGRLTRNPEMKYSQNESKLAVARYTLAVDRPYRKEETLTDFIPCVAFGRTAEFAVKHLEKGKKIALCGHLNTNSYTDKDGNKAFSMNVIVDEHYFAEAKKGNSVGSDQEADSANTTDENGFMKIPAGEELPFE